MRVLLFRWLCDSGGVSTSMLLLGRELERRGVACEYWFCKPSSRVAEFEAAGPTTVAPLGYLAPRLGRGDFDVVQMSSSDPGARLVAHMARPARVVVTNRGALAEGWNARTCFAYTAVSAAMARASQPGTDLEVEVIRNAVDLDRFAPPAARRGGVPIVAFVGRTTAPEKDFPRFTRIARHLVERGARVWIADPHGANWADFHGLPVARFDAERWGPVPFEEMPAFYRAVAESGGTLLMTSRSEGFGNAAVEAAASGAMTVAPDLLGLQESVIDGVTGVHFDPAADDASVAELAFARMQQQPAPERCAAAAARFSPAALADAYIALYRRPAQRLAREPAASIEVPGMTTLREHLLRQRAWRADASLSAALSLAARGYPALAVTAIGQALDAAPGRLLRVRGLQQFLGAAAWIARRPDRLYRQWRVRNAALAAPPATH